MPTRREQVEEMVFSALEDISQELGLPVHRYPEVYWIGRNGFSFSDVCLPASFRSFFERNRVCGDSFTCDSQPVICIGRYNVGDIAEEATHFLHSSLSPIKTGSLSEDEAVSFQILSEALAYFGSKLIYPQRQSDFVNLPDFSSMTLSQQSRLVSFITRFSRGSLSLQDFVIHQRGYALGDALFCAYSCNHISAPQIAYLFRKRFDYTRDATQTLSSLSARFS